MTPLLRPWLDVFAAALANPPDPTDPGQCGLVLETLRCLSQVVQYFAKSAGDALVAPLGAAARLFHALAPAYHATTIGKESDEYEPPRDDEGEELSLESVVSQLLELIMCLVEHPHWFHENIPDARLEIFEAPRFFEGFVRGREPDEVVDIVARICGICPVAYQVSASRAFEAAFGVALPEPVRALRRLLYCGEWIESHVLHAFFLHAPDFLGYPDAISMAADHREVVQLGLAIKKVGNALVIANLGTANQLRNRRVGLWV